MAKLVRTMACDFRTAVGRIKNAVLSGSVTASLEDEWYSNYAHSRCAVMVFERYSHMGGNRVSMSVTIYQDTDGPVQVCAITSGGSQAMFFKVNTLGEEAFLDTIRDAL